MSHITVKEPLTTIESWAQWKKCWEENPIDIVREGLLHRGFSVSLYLERNENQGHDRILTYLDIADGWQDESSFRIEDEHYLSYSSIRVSYGNPQPLPEIRRVLAEKAFKELCKNFFQEQDEHLKMYHFDALNESYWDRKLGHGVLEKVLLFFQCNEHNHVKNVPYEVGIHKKYVEHFLFTLCRLAFEKGCEKKGELMIKLEAAQPHFLSILVALGRLEYLFEQNISDACLKNLEAIVMGTEIWLPSQKAPFRNELLVPNSIEEACIGKDPTARTLLVLKTIKKEKERLAAIQQAKLKEMEAKRELQKLQQQ